MSTTTVDLRALASTRESIIYQDGGLFPVAAQAADGSLLAVLRGGAGHLGLAGRIDLVRSRDNGLTWAPPVTIADSAVDDRNPAFGLTPKGTLVLAYYHQASYDETGKYTPEMGNFSVRVTRSVDNGLTWSEPYKITDFHGFRGSPYGRIIQLGDNAIGMSVYSTVDQPGYPGGSYLLRSYDDGLTWEAPALIGKGRDETSILSLPNGDLLAAMRKTKRDEQSLAISRSNDLGRSWSGAVEITGSMQHPADLVMLDDHRVLLTYGNRQPPFRIEGRISEDLGATWRPELLTFSGHLYGYDIDPTRRTDLGYPTNIITSSGEAVTIYYYNPFHQTIHREWTGPSTTHYYLATNYRGICVRWSVAELLEALG